MCMCTGVSTVQNPLGFFGGFFPNGFDRDFGNFFKMTTAPSYYCPIAELEIPNCQYMIDYDIDEGYIVVIDYDFSRTDGVIVQSKFKRCLSVELSDVLEPEIENAIKLTENAILSNLNAEKALLDNLLSNMAFIIDREVPKISLPKYIPLCTTILRSYISEIEIKYSRYISRNKSTYLKYLTPKNAVINRSLSMRSDKLKNLGKLLQMLKEEGFVEQDLSLSLFRKAFDGSVIEKPLGIRWIKKRNGRTYHASISIMIDLLKEKGYISKSSNAQLSNIFVKWNDEPIKERNWDSGRCDARKSIENGTENAILKEMKRTIDRF